MISAPIGLEKFKKLITSETAFYILSEDANRNLDDLMSLLSDKNLTKKLYLLHSNNRLPSVH